jgi:2-keto-4-pentenoate hydratase/2-oxohepta-3-ene-1,7-dioic acid hydratase in catechol pathway
LKAAIIKSQNKSVPIGTIFCIGKNYAKHAAELGGTVEEKPVVFLKPISSVIFSGEKIQLPAISNNVHHEVELVVLIGKGGKDIPRSEALSHVLGYAAGLDLTLRDVQDVLKKKGLPWTISKGFDTSACLTDFVEAAAIPDPQKLWFTLDVNGERRQTGDTAMMLFPVDVLIEYLSSIFTLERGDIIYTGTPEGVGKIDSGDILAINLMDLAGERFSVA